MRQSLYVSVDVFSRADRVVRLIVRDQPIIGGERLPSDTRIEQKIEPFLHVPVQVVEDVIPREAHPYAPVLVEIAGIPTPPHVHVAIAAYHEVVPDVGAVVGHVQALDVLHRDGTLADVPAPVPGRVRYDDVHSRRSDGLHVQGFPGTPLPPRDVFVIGEVDQPLPVVTIFGRLRVGFNLRLVRDDQAHRGHEDHDRRAHE